MKHFKALLTWTRICYTNSLKRNNLFSNKKKVRLDEILPTVSYKKFDQAYDDLLEKYDQTLNSEPLLAFYLRELLNYLEIMKEPQHSGEKIQEMLYACKAIDASYFYAVEQEVITPGDTVSEMNLKAYKNACQRNEIRTEPQLEKDFKPFVHLCVSQLALRFNIDCEINPRQLLMDLATYSYHSMISERYSGTRNANFITKSSRNEVLTHLGNLRFFDPTPKECKKADYHERVFCSSSDQAIVKLAAIYNNEELLPKDSYLSPYLVFLIGYLHITRRPEELNIVLRAFKSFKIDFKKQYYQKRKRSELPKQTIIDAFVSVCTSHTKLTALQQINDEDLTILMKFLVSDFELEYFLKKAYECLEENLALSLLEIDADSRLNHEQKLYKKNKDIRKVKEQKEYLEKIHGEFKYLYTQIFRPELRDEVAIMKNGTEYAEACINSLEPLMKGDAVQGFQMANEGLRARGHRNSISLKKPDYVETPEDKIYYEHINRLNKTTTSMGKVANALLQRIHDYQDGVIERLQDSCGWYAQLHYETLLEAAHKKFNKTIVTEEKYDQEGKKNVADELELTGAVDEQHAHSASFTAESDELVITKLAIAESEHAINEQKPAESQVSARRFQPPLSHFHITQESLKNLHSLLSADNANDASSLLDTDNPSGGAVPLIPS